MALALGGYFSSASNVFTGSLVNLQTWFSARFVAIQDFFTSPRDIASLRQRNAELEGEVADLQAQVIQLQQEVGDTKILEALLDFVRVSPENTYRAAAVTLQAGSAPAGPTGTACCSAPTWAPATPAPPAATTRCARQPSSTPSSWTCWASTDLAQPPHHVGEIVAPERAWGPSWPPPIRIGRDRTDVLIPSRQHGPG